MGVGKASLEELSTPKGLEKLLLWQAVVMAMSFRLSR